MKNDDRKMEIEQLADDDARAHLKETYADPEAAGRFFDQLLDTRRKSIDSLAEELNGDERLSETFARNPIGFLNDRKLLGPLDQITLDGLRNPFLDWPWPWPICRIRCTLEAFTETHWVCIGFWPLRICWPVLHIHFRWVCRIVCD
jgi:hypothetical protein